MTGRDAPRTSMLDNENVSAEEDVHRETRTGPRGGLPVAASVCGSPACDQAPEVEVPALFSRLRAPAAGGLIGLGDTPPTSRAANRWASALSAGEAGGLHPLADPSTRSHKVFARYHSATSLPAADGRRTDSPVLPP